MCNSGCSQGFKRKGRVNISIFFKVFCVGGGSKGRQEEKFVLR